MMACDAEDRVSRMIGDDFASRAQPSYRRIDPRFPAVYLALEPCKRWELPASDLLAL